MNETISFPDAIATTQNLMTQMEENKITEEEIEQAIASLVSSKNGARGFFVAYLTGDLSLADNPSPGVINALKSSPELVSELLVKNLAMSAAMAITHRRNNDTDNVAGSEKVCRRSAKLIQKLDLDLIKKNLSQLQTTITTGKGNYTEFLQRWGYDSEQQQAIDKAIGQISNLGNE
ncbi:MAG: hypothetical protein Tsb0014_07300 [Pleurocapsa sp.]